MRICFLVGSVKISGGTYVIFQHAHYLQKQLGHEVILAVQEPFQTDTYAWHDRSGELTIIPIQDSYNLEFDLVIATWWKTALELKQYSTANLAYFVQSIESRFYSDNEVPLKRYVDSTYDLNVHYCTEATWIKQHLRENHGKESALVFNGIRKDIYFSASDSQKRQHPRVLIEGPFNVGFKNTGLAIAAAKKAGAKDVWVLTSTPVRYLPFADKIYSQVPISEVADIYRQCDLIVKLSTVEGMFGPPLEQFHCGGSAVVLNVSGHDEYIENGVNGAVIKERGFDVIVSRIAEVINDKKKLASLQSAAQQTADNWPDWPTSSKLFGLWVSEIQEKGRCVDSIEASLSKAESEYIVEEQQRLKTRSFIQKVTTACVNRISSGPNLLTALVFQFIAIKEVLFHSKDVK